MKTIIFKIEAWKVNFVLFLFTVGFTIAFMLRMLQTLDIVSTLLFAGAIICICLKVNEES